MCVHIKRQHLIHRQDEKLELSLEPTQTLEQRSAPGLDARQVRACKLAGLLDVPVDIFVKLASVLRDQIAISQFRRPVPPCQKAFVSVAEIRLLVLDSASQ